MRKVLVLVPVTRGAIDDVAWEILSAARGLAGADGLVTAVLAGHGVTAFAGELSRRFDEVILLDDPLLAAPDGEVLAGALAPLIEREKPLPRCSPTTTTPWTSHPPSRCGSGRRSSPTASNSRPDRTR